MTTQRMTVSKGDADRTDENFGVEEIFEELGVIAELEGRDVRPAGGAQPEAVDHDENRPV
jgi:hypothetical protein